MRAKSRKVGQFEGMCEDEGSSSEVEDERESESSEGNEEDANY